MTLSPRAAATRQTILDAARACFAERGLAATTTREIARRAGVTQPLVHHYFGTKDALFDAVLEASVSDYDDAQAQQWALPMGDLRFLTRGLTVLFRWLGQHQDMMRLATWARLEGRVFAVPGALDIYQKVLERLRHAKTTGLLRPQVDLDVVMISIDALFKGYWDRREALKVYPIDRDELDERFLRETLRMLFVSLLVPEAAEIALRDVRSPELEPGS